MSQYIHRIDSGEHIGNQLGFSIMSLRFVISLLGSKHSRASSCARRVLRCRLSSFGRLRVEGPQESFRIRVLWVLRV